MKKAAILLAFVMVVSCAKKKEETSEIRAGILLYAGSVKLNSNALTASGVPVKYGDVIETGDKSFCEIIVNDKNIIKLGEKTELVFRLSEKDNFLELKKGWMSGVTKKIFTKEQTFLIKSPTAVASVRGTSFCTKVENPDSTYFCVCNGKIELKKSDGTSAEMVENAHHGSRRFKKVNGALVIDKNAGLLYHDDKGIEELAKKINVAVDWKKAE